MPDNATSNRLSNGDLHAMTDATSHRAASDDLVEIEVSVDSYNWIMARSQALAITPAEYVEAMIEVGPRPRSVETE